MSFLQYVVQVMAELVNIVYYMYQVLPKNLCNYKRMLSIVMQIVNRSLFRGTLFNHFCCFYIMRIPVCWSSLFKINSHHFFWQMILNGTKRTAKLFDNSLIWFLSSLFCSCLGISVLSVTTWWRETVSFNYVSCYWYLLIHIE